MKTLLNSSTLTNALTNAAGVLGCCLLAYAVGTTPALAQHGGPGGPGSNPPAFENHCDPTGYPYSGGGGANVENCGCDGYCKEIATEEHVASCKRKLKSITYQGSTQTFCDCYCYGNPQ